MSNQNIYNSLKSFKIGDRVKGPANMEGVGTITLIITGQEAVDLRGEEICYEIKWDDGSWDEEWAEDGISVECKESLTKV